MADTDRRIPLALIPTRQPITVVAALVKLLGAVLVGTDAAMAPGNSADVASTLLSGDTDPNVLAGRLYAAAQVLGADLSDSEAALIDHAADASGETIDDAVQSPTLTIGHQTASDDGAVDITFGVEEGEAAANLAHHVLAAFMPLAERMGVENYLEYEGVDRSTGRRALLTFHVPGGKRPSLLHQEAAAERDQMQSRVAAALAVCDAGEHQATRWEQPFPIPAWVTDVRAALVGDQTTEEA
ncbi:hypothetical protein ACWEOE_31760 [Amycolatopsis sp. NPDC004368]